MTTLSRRANPIGAIELRRAISRSLNRSFYDQTDGYAYLPSYGPEEIIVSTAPSHLQAAVAGALCRPGDEALLFAPYRESYPGMVRMAGATPVVVSAGSEAGFVPSVDAVEAALTTRTRLVFLNCPGNPGGRVWTRTQIGDLCDLVLAHDGLYLVSDETCAGFVYGEARHFSPVIHSERMRQRTIITSGVSRKRGSRGWRIGYAAIADTELMAGVRTAARRVVSSLPSATQGAAARALEDRARACAMRIEFERRAGHLTRRLCAMGLPTLPVQGGFYAFANVSSLFGAKIEGVTLQSARDVATALLGDARVASVAGECFGTPDYIRLPFVRPMEALDATCDAIEAFALRHRPAVLPAGVQSAGDADQIMPASADTMLEPLEPAAEPAAMPHTPA